MTIISTVQTTILSQLSLDFLLPICPNMVKLLMPILQSNVFVDIIRLVKTNHLLGQLVFYSEQTCVQFTDMYLIFSKYKYFDINLSLCFILHRGK